MSEEERGTEKNGETNKSNKKESLKKKRKEENKIYSSQCLQGVLII